MKKKSSKYSQGKINWLNHWYILALALFFAVISVYALRQNNLTMIKLRDQVFVADKANGDVEGALKNLRQYIYSHMNTNLSSSTGVKPPIQLKYTYERLVAAEKKRTGSDNAQIYTDAQHHCERLYPQSFSGGPRVPCIKNYVTSHGGVKEQPISEELYKFDFASPSWTPDLAGLSLVITFMLLIVFAIKFSLDLWLKHDLKNQM